MSTQKMSKGQLQTGLQSGRRTLGRCNKGKTRNVVCVDVDEGKSEEYIFIDTPEFSQETLHGSKVSLKKPPSNIFINIEDDEANVDEIENCDKIGRDQECGGTSTKVSSPAYRRSKSVKKSNIFDNIQQTRAKRSPVTFSKSRRTYSAKAIPSHMGLNSAYDSSSSDSDNSDCELMEGLSGNIREQWEKAFLKRKMTDGAQNGHTGSDNEASGSGSFRDTPTNVDVENTSTQHVEEPFCSTSNNNSVEDCNVPTSTSSGNAVARDPVLDVDLDDQDGPSMSGNTPREEAHIFHEKVNIHDCGNTSQVEHLSDSEEEIKMDIDQDEFYSSIKETEIPVGPQLSENVCFQEEAKTVPGEEDLWVNYEACFEADFHDKTTLHDEDVSLHNTKRSEVTDANYHSHSTRDTNKMNSETPKNDGRAEFNYKGNSVLGESSFDEKEPALSSDDKIEQEVEKSTLDTGDLDGTNAQDAGNSCILVDREKLKETEEYKRAAEEEWASRQHQLQLQAEEAQRLKKRKRAETQRILDMERRQRERLEEMRETQKKNTETINMKEHLRAEVRKELVRLELIHTDMVSLLRALGIPVGTGFCPTSQEVNAAYKQAMLKFHPDRASKTDIRLQVEAEEKFKLISRLKEKLTTSTHKLF